MQKEVRTTNTSVVYLFSLRFTSSLSVHTESQYISQVKFIRDAGTLAINKAFPVVTLGVSSQVITTWIVTTDAFLRRDFAPLRSM